MRKIDKIFKRWADDADDEWNEIVTTTIESGKKAKDWWEWRENGDLWIVAPGADKEIVNACMYMNKLRISWKCDYSKGDWLATIPKGTKDIELSVINGMIVVKFDVKESDVSIEIK